MKVLVVDIGGNYVKILATGQNRRRRAKSGPSLMADQMVAAVRELAEDWDYDVVSVGFPGCVKQNRPVTEPVNLGTGWTDFDFATAFDRPVKMVNDALMQAIGSYEGGAMLFLGLGTGLGSALVVDNVAHPLELAHLPYKNGRTFEDCVGSAGLRRSGKRRWREDVADVVARLRAAVLPDYIVIGGGNVGKLSELPPGCRRGSNANAFRGGFRLWEDRAMTVSGSTEKDEGVGTRVRVGD